MARKPLLKARQMERKAGISETQTVCVDFSIDIDHALTGGNMQVRKPLTVGKRNIEVTYLNDLLVRLCLCLDLMSLNVHISGVDDNSPLSTKA